MCKRQAGFVTLAALALVLALTPFVIWVIFLCLENPSFSSKSISSEKAHFSANCFGSIPIGYFPKKIQDECLGCQQVMDGIAYLFRLNKDRMPFSGLQRRIVPGLGVCNHLANVVMYSAIQRDGLPFKISNFGTFNEFNIKIAADILRIGIAHVCENELYPVLSEIIVKLYASDNQVRNMRADIFCGRYFRLLSCGFGCSFSRFPGPFGLCSQFSRCEPQQDICYSKDKREPSYRISPFARFFISALLYGLTFYIELTPRFTLTLGGRFTAISCFGSDGESFVLLASVFPEIGGIDFLASSDFVTLNANNNAIIKNMRIVSKPLSPQRKCQRFMISNVLLCGGPARAFDLAQC